VAFWTFVELLDGQPDPEFFFNDLDGPLAIFGFHDACNNERANKRFAR
jgi:hypothetical protein